MMCDITRKRLLGTPLNIHPRAVIGKGIYLLDMKRYLEREHEKGGWNGKQNFETQAVGDFKFDGKAFRRYTRKVLGRDLERLYFPAAYAGKIAKALKEEGYDVFATDLGNDWVAHLRSLGLRTEKRSFEDIPKERFDAVVCFEPYCIPRPVAYIAILRMMADSLLCIDISVSDHKRSLYGRQLRHLAEKRILRDVSRKNGPDGRVLRLERGYPLNKRRTDRIAYDYGAGYGSHSVFDAEYRYGFIALKPTPESSGRASLDLRVIEELNSGQGDRASLDALANALEKPVNEVAASVRRLMDVFNQRLMVGLAVEYEDPHVIESAVELTKKELHDLVRRITFVE